MIHRVAKSWTQLKQLRMHKLIFKCLWRNKGSYTAKPTLKEKVKEMRGFPNTIFRYPKSLFNKHYSTGVGLDTKQCFKIERKENGKWIYNFSSPPPGSLR